MTFDPVANDPATVDREYPATMAALTIESHGKQCIGVMLIAQGSGPHPTILLLHGFPGNERNFDLAQVFRRAGWNVLVFHYRGSWGSQGSYSFTHVLEDVRAALAFLRAESSEELYRVDTGSIVLVGHSMGGFAALLTAAHDPLVRAVASIAGCNCASLAEALQGDQGAREEASLSFKEALSRLQGTTAEALAQEMIQFGQSWDLIEHVATLVDRSVLLVAGSRDEVLADVHHTPLVRTLQDDGAKDLTHVILDADHSFSDKRIALARVVLSWLEEQRAG